MTPKNLRQVKQTIAPVTDGLYALNRSIRVLEQHASVTRERLDLFERMSFRQRLAWLLRGTLPALSE